MGVGSGGVVGSEASEVALGLGVGVLGLGSGAEALGLGAGVLGLGLGVGFTSEGGLRTSVDTATPWTVFALTTKEFPLSPSTV